ncbi:MsnO8 family LLM class oxidoreductase [Patulibacter sp. NPDC049589]|uniref:MsnO8 family LLM class oxidoreductase n=1 Tax=Patulibacter sp. NPDC049589 TaxID=3154731 RepID=UPI0034480415
MNVSIIDLGTVGPDGDESRALAESIRTAQHAEAHGFHRVWFAEHHVTASNASHHPELLIAAAGAQTSRIHVGSGSVLLNHYSPLKVAEMFQQLEAMYPGRVDLGIGRASGGPAIDLALRPDRRSQPVDDHPQRVAEVLAWLEGTFPAEHPFAGHPLMPSVTGRPSTWLLGSSPQGAGLAAQLGLGYTFAGFINPGAAAGALQDYRRRFRRRDAGPAEPRAMLAVNVSLGEDDDDGRRLVGSAKGFYARLGRLGAAATIPPGDVGLAELTPEQRDEPTSIVRGRWPRFVAGGPDAVRATLEEMLQQSGADELMVQNLIADPEDRRASHARLARLLGLQSAARPEAAPARSGT